MNTTSPSGGRRAVGWVLLLLGVVLVLSTVLRLPGALSKARAIGGAEGLGYAVGSLVLGVVGIWLFRVGQRWRRVA